MHTILTWFARLFCAIAIAFFYRLMEISWAYAIFIIVPLIFLAASFPAVQRILRSRPAQSTPSVSATKGDHHDDHHAEEDGESPS